MEVPNDPQIDPALQEPAPPPPREPEAHPSDAPRSPDPPRLASALIPESGVTDRPPSVETLQSMAGGHGPPGDRQLNVTDALSYLDAVKGQFHDRPDVYNIFLDIMKDFKSQVIDTPGVIQRVSNLFHGHPTLIQGFNTFLPVGYRIEVNSDSRSADVITVTTPQGTMTQSTKADYPLPPPYQTLTLTGKASQPVSPSLQPAPSSPSSPSSETGLGPAMDYVQRIKTRFIGEPETYKRFLEILSSHNGNANVLVYAQVEELFRDAPDLSSAFREFLPTGVDQEEVLQAHGHLRTTTPTVLEHSRAQKRKQPPVEPAAPPSGGPSKRRRKALVPEKDIKEKEKDGRVGSSKTKKTKALTDASPSFSHYATITAPTTSSHHIHHAPVGVQMYHTSILPHQIPAADDAQFFARVKQALDVRDVYGEFLKVVNLFTQNFIDRARLIRESRTYLGDGPLMAQLKAIVGWDESMERAALAREREEAFLPPGRPMTILDRPSKEELNIRYGSYRRLPADEVDVVCSGRDEMCRSVLNDEWVSHPAFDAEDSVFLAHKKNIYEEALHRSEEERHEYDFHIDALARTIALLEPIAVKILAMSPEERVNFKLKPNFGGQGKAVHQRIIKKLYTREAGLEVIQALQESPAQALPVVLQRLKQKEGEWKRAQSAWNKVWRAVDEQNYARSLDHQAIAFRAADKKGLTTKAFLGQIEAAMEAQVSRRAMLIDPGFARARPAHQLAFVIEDTDVLRDAVKLVFSYLARVAGTQMRLDTARKNWIETRLYNVVRAFFGLGDGWAAPAPGEAADFVKKGGEPAGRRGKKAGMLDAGAGDDGSEEAGPSTPRVGSNGRLAGSFAGDLRKNLLKSEQAKSTRAQARPSAPATPSPMGSRMASPAPLAPLSIDEDMPDLSQLPASPVERPLSRRRSFFTSTWFYTLLRMVEVLYSRLSLFKGIAVERAGASSPAANPTAADLELADAELEHELVSPREYYEFLLESCERLFDNQIEQSAFEDTIRDMFGLHHAYKIFTIDKVVAAIIRHVQSWEQDQKLDKLMKVLWDERRLEHPTAEDHRKFRRQAEEILGPEDILFRIDWLPESKTMTCQLLSKDGSSLDDAEVLSGRWQAYIDSFVSDHETQDIPASKVRRPFLRRSLPRSQDTQPEVIAKGNVEIKVCVRTYRFFYVSNTEDVLWRRRSLADRERGEAALQGRNAARKQWLETFKAGPPPVEPATTE